MKAYSELLPFGVVYAFTNRRSKHLYSITYKGRVIPMNSRTDVAPLHIAKRKADLLNAGYSIQGAHYEFHRCPREICTPSQRKSRGTA
jgi:hypothetical protein